MALDDDSFEKLRKSGAFGNGKPAQSPPPGKSGGDKKEEAQPESAEPDQDDGAQTSEPDAPAERSDADGDAGGGADGDADGGADGDAADDAAGGAGDDADDGADDGAGDVADSEAVVGAKFVMHLVTEVQKCRDENRQLSQAVAQLQTHQRTTIAGLDEIKALLSSSKTPATPRPSAGAGGPFLPLPGGEFVTPSAAASAAAPLEAAVNARVNRIPTNINLAKPLSATVKRAIVEGNFFPMFALLPAYAAPAPGTRPSPASEHGTIQAGPDGTLVVADPTYPLCHDYLSWCAAAKNWIAILRVVLPEEADHAAIYADNVEKLACSAVNHPKLFVQYDDRHRHQHQLFRSNWWETDALIWQSLIGQAALNAIPAPAEVVGNKAKWTQRSQRYAAAKTARDVANAADFRTTRASKKAAVEKDESEDRRMCQYEASKCPVKNCTRRHVKSKK